MAYYTGVIASIKLGDSASPTDILGQCTSYSVDKQLESVDVSHIGSTSKHLHPLKRVGLAQWKLVTTRMTQHKLNF